MHIDEQISSGKLCCPKTFQTLKKENNMLVSADGTQRYAMQGDILIFMEDAGVVAVILKENPSMEREYAAPNIYQSIRKFFYKDHNSKAHDQAFNDYIKNQPSQALVLEILLSPLYRMLENKPAYHVLASTTFVLAKKR